MEAARPPATTAMAVSPSETNPLPKVPRCGFLVGVEGAPMIGQPIADAHG